ncbi:MAG: hypothetical protein JRI25_09170, partial [Deltaproteobacteria bacterium]|nr:hypothetical protein [Deltaproteobacteria bacterium]MBW2254751.1 hypothetical protein [Deltaproteobacteria bacterium]
MNDDILDHPDVKALLREADSALALLKEVGDQDPGNFRAALNHIYADLGRTIHENVPPAGVFDDDEPTAVNAAPAPDGVDEVPALVIEEPDDDPTDPRFTPTPPPKRVVTPKGMGLVERGMDSLPARKPAKRKRAADRRSATARAVGSRTPPPAAARGKNRVTTPSPPPLRGDPVAPDAPWIEQLGDLLEALAMPFDLDAPKELAAEASLIQWATVGLDEQWVSFPPTIQAALLGLIVSRARHLQDHLEVHVAPRLALERLSAYRSRVGLSKVEGLYPERHAQTNSWAEDARQWWETLVEGLRTA